MQIDTALLEYATPSQAMYIQAINETGSQQKAAKMLGVNIRNLERALVRLRTNAAKSGYSPEHDMIHTAPAPFLVKGVSSYYDRDGKLTGQWVKTALDAEAYRQSIKEGIEAFYEDLPPIKANVVPLNYDSDIIPWIQIGDAHLGLLAHAAEIGENFDLHIAQAEMLSAIVMLVDELPMCERIVINDLGDFTHYENFSATTEASGHALDFDSRFPKMIRVYSATMRAIVDKALTKARYVDVIVNQGNHSRTNDIWMAELLRVAYGSTGRVNILNNDNPFIGYRMGNTLVMTNHSDKCKPALLADVMITDFRQDYGETEYHYIDIGHVHHGMVMKEYPSIFIESFNHLASLDKWAHDSGYRNRKSITVVLRSRTYGEVGRRVLPIQQIRDKFNIKNNALTGRAFAA